MHITKAQGCEAGQSRQHAVAADPNAGGGNRQRTKAGQSGQLQEAPGTGVDLVTHVHMCELQLSRIRGICPRLLRTPCSKHQRYLRSPARSSGSLLTSDGAHL